MISKNSTRKSIFIGFFVLSLLITSVGIASAKGYMHAPVIDVDGVNYYMAGVADGPNDATDIPGHEWDQAGPNQVVGKPYNSRPYGASQWWSSDAPDGAFLYKVKGIIDTWSPEKAGDYASRGFVHYHELVRVSDGAEHPTKVVWLKHIAVRSFNFDRGPHPELGREVSPGVDYEFIPNGFMPYNQ